MTGVAKNTVVKLLLEVAEVCREYQDRVFRNLTCKRLRLAMEISGHRTRSARTPTRLHRPIAHVERLCG